MGTTHEFHNTPDPTEPELSPGLRETVSAYALVLKAQFGTELQSPQAAAKVGRLFAKLVSPQTRRCGRPRSVPVTAAIQLADQGVPRAQIPWKVIPDFGKLSHPEQSCAREQLRRAMYMRRKREGVTKSKRRL
jgi:hypothetical protein